MLISQKPTYDELEKKIQKFEKAEDERKRVEDELQNSEEKFRVLFEKSIHGILIVDIETRRFPYANPAFCQMFGYSESEMLQIGVKDIHPKDSLEYILSVFRRQKKGKKAGATELPCIHKDGTVFNADIAATNIVVNHRKCVVGFFIDITERKRAEKVLQKAHDVLEQRVAERTKELELVNKKLQKDIVERINSEIDLARIKNAIDQSFDAIGMATEEGQHFYQNDTFTKMFGYDLNEVVSMHPKKLYQNHDIADQVFKTIMGGDIWTGQINMISKNGRQIPIELRANAIKNEQGKVVGLVGIHSDITERLKLEARLIQAQKMESIGSLAGGISHDFNNILFPIVGMSELLLEDLPTDSPEHEYAQEIFKAGKRGADLVQQILTFSRQSEHKIIPVRIQQILKEVLKLSRVTIPANIEINLEIQHDCGLVMANPTQIHQVALNLITNAFHAVEESNEGIISIHLKETLFSKDDIDALGFNPDKYAQLTISDNGHGIPKKLINKIFDPYFTTKELGKGTGLGPSAVYGIIQDHHGEITVTSKVGKGTSFNVLFPIMQRKSVDLPLNKIIEPETGEEHILLVDDEEAIVKLELQMLNRLGYKVTTRVNSHEALNAFKANPHNFDLVVTDMTMPGMTGYQLAQEILSVRSDIPIIICTGFSEQINKSQAEMIGVKSFLMKPVIKSNMAQVVRKVLDESKKS